MKILSEEAVVIGLEQIDLDQFPKLKVLGCNCTGLDHLPWNELERRNIKVISLRDYPLFSKFITSTAEHTIGLMLAVARSYKTALTGTDDRESYKGHTLSDKTLGIIGYGRIGRQVEAIARALGMKVWPADKGDAIQLLLAKSDFVTIHVPLPGNEGFFTKELFSQMKRSAYLINTSRDKVIEPGALIWALENGLIAGAAIDFQDDPALVEYARNHESLVLTNHIGGCTFEDREKTESFITQQVINYLER